MCRHRVQMQDGCLCPPAFPDASPLAGRHGAGASSCAPSPPRPATGVAARATGGSPSHRLWKESLLHSSRLLFLFFFPQYKGAGKRKEPALVAFGLAKALAAASDGDGSRGGRGRHVVERAELCLALFRKMALTRLMLLVSLQQALDSQPPVGEAAGRSQAPDTRRQRSNGARLATSSPVPGDRGVSCAHPSRLGSRTHVLSAGEPTPNKVRAEPPCPRARLLRADTPVPRCWPALPRADALDLICIVFLLSECIFFPPLPATDFTLNAAEHCCESMYGERSFVAYSGFLFFFFSPSFLPITASAGS